MTNVIVVIWAGSIGQAIARRVSAGKQVLLADLRQENAEAAAKTLRDAGFNVTVTTVDVASRISVHSLVEKAASLGEVFGLIHAAGVSPSQATPETILKVDLYGTALVLEKFGNVIAPGGSGVVIALQSGHRNPQLSTKQNAALATTPVDELLASISSTRSGEGLPSCLPAFKTRKLVAGHGRGGRLGQAWCAGQHNQPRHYHHPACKR